MPGAVGGWEFDGELYELWAAVSRDALELSVVPVRGSSPPPTVIPWAALTDVRADVLHGPRRRFSFQGDGVPVALAGPSAHIAHGAWRRAVRVD